MPLEQYELTEVAAVEKAVNVCCCLSRGKIALFSPTTVHTFSLRGKKKKSSSLTTLIRLT